MENKNSRLTRLENKRKNNVIVVYEDEDNAPGQLYFDDFCTKAVSPDQVDQWEKAKTHLVIITYSSQALPLLQGDIS